MPDLSLAEHTLAAVSTCGHACFGYNEWTRDFPPYPNSYKCCACWGNGDDACQICQGRTHVAAP